MTSKQILRREARERRAVEAAAAPAYAADIARLADTISIRAGAIVASYWPVRDEADPRALAAALASKGHPIALPYLAGPNEKLIFRLWRDGDPMSPNRHGIHEPEVHAEAVVPEVVLVPLLAFDREGARLGYGGGYYDRTLMDLRMQGYIVAIGVAYAGQEVEKLPRDPHDQRLDMVVTEQGLRTFGK